MEFNINNPAVKDLVKLKLIDLTSSELISNKTRDKKIRVFRDKKSRVIFLEKYTKSDNYYETCNNLDYDRTKKNNTKKIQKVRTTKGIVKSIILQDDLRRSKYFNKISKNKNILDFGCGWAGYLSLINSTKKKHAVELRKECINYIKKQKKISISNNIDSLNTDFEIITMFHVLEHIPDQIKIIKKLREKLKKRGKIIIEVPHANDILLDFEELKKFKEFTFFSEHLILHTKKSLEKLLKHTGFRNIKINFIQRYSFANHLGWFLRGVPNGHSFFHNYSSKELDKAYSDHLINIGKTDTLIAIAEK